MRHRSNAILIGICAVSRDGLAHHRGVPIVLAELCAGGRWAGDVLRHSPREALLTVPDRAGFNVGNNCTTAAKAHRIKRACADQIVDVDAIEDVRAIAPNDSPSGQGGQRCDKEHGKRQRIRQAAPAA